MKSILILMSACAFTWSAQAQDRNALLQNSLAATCANCHGSFGRSCDGASIGNLAGMPAKQIVEQMKAFQSGARPATVMHQLSKGYSDAQIEQLASYFAAQNK